MGCNFEQKIKSSSYLICIFEFCSYLPLFLLFLGVTIAFRQPQYIVNEDDGSVQISYPIIGSTQVALNYMYV